MNVVETVPIGAAITTAHFGQDPFYEPSFLANFDGLTPENELKWENTEPQQGQFTFTAADQLINWAIANGKSVRGHVLISNQQNPSWVTDPKTLLVLGHPWTRDELIGVMREHIMAVVGHFRGRIPEWDVVNEAFNADGSWQNSLWFRVIGPDYVALAFQFAHEADPQAKLFYNDTGYETGGPHTDAVYALIRGLRQQGVPVDGVGFESHFTSDTRNITERMRPVMAAFAGLGLSEEITELDVDTSFSSVDKLAAEADVYRQVAHACVEQVACQRVTVWGYTDRYSWIGSDRLPLPFDADYQPKPAWTALQSELRP